MTTTAMACLASGRVAEARSHYEELLADFPADKAAMLMRDFAAKQEGEHDDAA